MDASLPLGLKKKKTRSLGGCVLRSIFFSTLLMLLLLMVAAAFAYRSDDPAAQVTPLSYAVALFTFFSGGFSAARRRGRQGLICGLLTGAGMAILFLIGYLCFIGDGEASLGRLLISHLLMLAVSLMGGVLGGVMPAGGTRRVRRSKRR